ncbi:MAG: SDR family NAD(P)-dependent oxidoreductase [Gammaproteobacteria bacterium]|nr:SDR family NAD(P)-dependent oxidoreductase [Gammaproteobacteria bacterium]
MIFKDKTVVITGGSEGIGAATARLFADAGANLMLVARSKKSLESIAAELRDKTRVEIFPMDVTDRDACVDLFKKADFEFGRVDILVNNAGYHARGDVREVPADDLGRIVDVNLKAPIVLSRLALPYMEDAGGGAIINVASLHGRLASAGATAYSCSKFGLRIFSLALRQELEGSGIKVAVVSPGPVDTGFIMERIEEVDDIVFSQPMSSAEEVGQVILDLCGNNIAEQSMPTSSGILTTAAYLMPWLRKWLKPVLLKKGARVKARLLAERAKNNAGQ